MYHRNRTPPSTPPPGYSGIAFGEHPAWPPQTEPPPRELRAPLQTQSFAPFAAGKRAVETPAEEPAPQGKVHALPQEEPPTSAPPPHTQPEAEPQQETAGNDETWLLLAILLLLTHGEDGRDLLPILSILLLL